MLVCVLVKFAKYSVHGCRETESMQCGEVVLTCVPAKFVYVHSITFRIQGHKSQYEM